MKPVLVFLTMGLLAITVCAEEFFLIDAAGKKNGPFEYVAGGKVSVAGQTYTIAKAVVNKKQAITDKMKAIVLPKVELREAHIADVVPFLQELSASTDKSGIAPAGVTIVLNIETVSGSGAAAKIPLVTYSAAQVSLFDALNTICKQCNLYWFVKDASVVVEPMIR